MRIIEDDEMSSMTIHLNQLKHSTHCFDKLTRRHSFEEEIAKQHHMASMSNLAVGPVLGTLEGHSGMQASS